MIVICLSYDSDRVYELWTSFDVWICDFDLGVALQHEEEADVLVGDVEDRVVVL